jgi:hypothetical protein
MPISTPPRPPFVLAPRQRSGSAWLITIILMAIVLSIGFFGFS